MASIDFLAVGDIVTEPFIRLKEAEVLQGTHKEDLRLAMRFGDKIPYDFAEVCRAVGNSANAAVAAARLGLRSGLVSDIGDDEIGKGNVAQLKSEGVARDFITKHKGMQSNYHYVLWYESERTILVRHEEYPYRFPKPGRAPKSLYVSSLASNSAAYHKEIEAYVAAHPDIFLTFQPGTFQMRLGTDELKVMYEQTNLLVVNRAEAMRILKVENDAVPELLHGLVSLGPKSVIITDDRAGAYAFDGTRMLSVPMYPDDRAPYERTGAGDAFATTVTAALMLGKPFEEALLWGPINAMAVVQEVGAQKGLLSRNALEEHLAKAPPEYTVSALS